MQAALSYGGVIFDSGGIRGKLNATFSNFTSTEALNGWPFLIGLDLREGTENGATVSTTTFTGLAKPSDATFSFSFSFNAAAGTFVLVANAFNAVFNTALGPKATKTVTYGMNGGSSASNLMKYLIMGGLIYVAYSLLGRKQR